MAVDRTITARVVLHVTLVCSTVVLDHDGTPLSDEDLVQLAIEGGTFDDTYGLNPDDIENRDSHGWVCCGEPAITEVEVT